MSQADGQGTLYILIGPGGVGKNALMNAVLGQASTLRQLPTATTRPPRPNEVEGVHHLFVSLAEFERMIAAGELLEHQEVHPGKYYGVPRATVEDAIRNGQDLIADIEFKGAAILRHAYPQNTVAVFIAPPTVRTLHDRLQERQASAVDTQDRLNRMAAEMRYAPLCDFLIVNDDMDEAVRQLLAVIVHRRTGAQPNLPQARYHLTVTVHQPGEPLMVAACGLRAGQAPDEAALACVRAQGIDAVADNLRYERGDAPPVVLAHNEVTSEYDVTYHYSYRVSTADAVMSSPSPDALDVHLGD